MAVALFQQLRLLDDIVAKAEAQKPLAKTAIICLQHLMETTGSLIEALLRLGAVSEAIFVVGKPYSSIPSVEEKLRALGVFVQPSAIGGVGGFGVQMQKATTSLWATVGRRRPQWAKTLVVLDEGGFCLKAMPAGYCLEPFTGINLASVEQTMSGIFHKPKLPIPVVRTASCAAKRLLEPPIIVREVLAKILAGGRTEAAGSYGILGLGNIGQATAARLLRFNGRVFVYDKEVKRSVMFSQGKRGVVVCNSSAELVQKARVIL